MCQRDVIWTSAKFIGTISVIAATVIPASAQQRPTGSAVDIGARVSSLAAAGQALVSSTVKDLVAGSGLSFEDRGEHRLKGVPDRWHLYRVVSD